MRYLSRAEIIHAILRAAESGTTKTRIMYSTYLSFSKTHEYVYPMIERDTDSEEDMEREEPF
jgi:predicted transcriptional regulator